MTRHRERDITTQRQSSEREAPRRRGKDMRGRRPDVVVAQMVGDRDLPQRQQRGDLGRI
jgi:hypothetical protein